MCQNLVLAVSTRVCSEVLCVASNTRSAIRSTSSPAQIEICGVPHWKRSERYKTKTSPSGHPACGLERCQLDTCNTKKKRQSRVRIQFLAARATIISDETDEKRTCLLGGGAGRSPIDRVIGGLRDRQGLFYLLTLESIRFVSSENEDLSVAEELTMFILSFNRSDVSGRVFFYYIEKIFPLVCIPI